jgi:hypothetical protein
MTDRRRVADRDVPGLSSGANERPSGELRNAVGADRVSVPDARAESPALVILSVAGSLGLGIVAAAIFGGVAWIGALLLLGAAVGWSLLEFEAARDGSAHERGFGADSTGRRRRLIPTAVVAGAGVVAGVIVVAALAGYR